MPTKCRCSQAWYRSYRSDNGRSHAGALGATPARRRPLGTPPPRGGAAAAALAAPRTVAPGRPVALVPAPPRAGSQGHGDVTPPAGRADHLYPPLGLRGGAGGLGRQEAHDVDPFDARLHLGPEIVADRGALGGRPGDQRALRLARPDGAPGPRAVGGSARQLNLDEAGHAAVTLPRTRPVGDTRRFGPGPRRIGRPARSGTGRARDASGTARAAAVRHARRRATSSARAR